MIEPLLKFIRDHSQSPVSGEEVALIEKSCVQKKLKKRQFLLQEGDVCRYLGFIVKGAIRQYTVDNKGNEQIIALSIENWWVGDRESFFKKTPSIYNIDAWEESDLLLLTPEHVERLNTIPAFGEMRRMLDENYSIAAQKRMLGSLSHSAEKRYEDLQKNYPEFLQRFPQHILASYLGITKETLSRIRNQALKK